MLFSNTKWKQEKENKTCIGSHNNKKIFFLFPNFPMKDNKLKQDR